MGESRLNMAAHQMVPLRPRRLFRGSESHPALRKVRTLQIDRNGSVEGTYNRQIEMYGQELMNPMSQELASQVPAATHEEVGESGMPSASGNERLAPFEPMTSMSAEALSLSRPIRQYLFDPILELRRRLNSE